MLREKANLVYTFLDIFDVIIAIVSFNLTVYIEKGYLTPFQNKDSIILHFIVVIAWFLLARAFGLNQLYRSRPYSAVLFGCMSLAIAGTSILAISVWVFELNSIGLTQLLVFGSIDLVLTFSFKTFNYSLLKRARSKGFNTSNVIVIGDSTARSFLMQLVKMKEWGYRISAIIGVKELEEEFGSVAPLLPPDTDIEHLLRNKTIDEVIFCKESASQKEIEKLVLLTSEVGVVLNMYSSFFNMLTNRTRLHYFGTTPMLSISNTPMS
jgi:FlaA1/EpsC-like NDP-sugar epimerase